MTITLLMNNSTYGLRYPELALFELAKLSIELFLELRVLGAMLVKQSQFVTRGRASLK